ncbi:MAG: response regulator [Cyclobacteriaceae bacterium]|nr:response regulator [Cyclobacteriaceae bacterium]
MNVLIVEDEYHAAERLRNQLKSLDQQIEVLGVAPSIAEAVKLLQVNPPDLVFLDIQLSDGLCFGIFEKVIPKWPVIFTTAYDQYAIKAFELHSIAYLLKPIKKEELAAGLLKFHQMRQLFQADVDLIARDMVAGTKYFKKRFW